MAMGFSTINQDLEILKAQGHEVRTNPGVCVVGNKLYVPIDGRLLSEREIHEMATPPDDVFSIQVNGKQGEIHFYYQREGPSYEVHLDGKKLGERQPVPDSEDVLAAVQRVAREMGATSLRRLR
jgi:hypothetical protein